MKMRLLFSVMLATGAASAKPVLWFHFDEKPCGSECSVSDRFVNAADIDGAAELNGTPRGLGWNSTTLDNSAWRVTYTNAFDLSTTWIDPKTGAKGDVRGVCLHVSGESDPIPAGTGHNGVITVPDSAKLHLDKFTVEFFMRKNVRVPFPNQVLPLQLYNSPSNTVAWQIRFSSYALGQTTSSVSINGSTTGGETAFQTISYTTKYSLYDGAWHHIAMTYDGAKCILYCDYVKLGEVKASIQYAEDVTKSLLTIGAATRVGWGRYHGLIDELRICDEVLTPGEFLRSIPLVCDKDTLVYVPFDRIDRGKGDFGYYGLTNNLNEVFPLGAPNFPYNTGAGALPVTVGTYNEDVTATLTNAVPVANIRDNMFATESMTNASALSVSANGPYVRINDDDDPYHVTATNEAVTYEFFFRRPPDDEDVILFMMHSGSAKTYVRYYNKTGGLIAMCCTTNLTSDGASVSYGDEDTHLAWAAKDEWHHFAFVSDAKRRMCQYYLDYQQYAVFTNAVLRPQRGVVHYAWGVNIGAAWTGSKFRGEVDELRITRRALRPREFLSMHGASELKAVNGHNVLLYAPFDSDMKAYPFRDGFGNVRSTSGTIAVTAADRPCETLPARSAMGLGEENKGSLGATGGKLVFQKPVCLHDLDAFTVEWYGRFENPHTSLPMVRFEGCLPGNSANQLTKRTTTGVYWQLAGGGAAPESLYLGVLADDFKTTKTLYFSAPAYRRNSWHHFALTCQKVIVGGVGKLECHLYVNHREAKPSWQKTQYIDVPGFMPAVSGLLRVGNASWCSYTGGIDELRFTEGVLTTDEMLPAVKRGLVMIVR